MNKTPPKKDSPKKRVVKAWAVVSEEGPLMEYFSHAHHTFGPRIYNTKEDGLAVISHMSTSRNLNVVPCTITYSL